MLLSNQNNLRLMSLLKNYATAATFVGCLLCSLFSGSINQSMID